MNSFSRNIKNLVNIIIFSAFVLTSSSVFAQSSTSRVYFKGPTSAVTPESIVSISVLVDSAEPINAFDLEISYPKDDLEFLNFDNTDSIVNIWKPDPSILPNGNLRLTGLMMKAWDSKGGLLIKLSFKALNSGDHEISFVINDLAKFDGKGTKIEASTTSFTLYAKEEAKMISEPIVPFKSTPENIIIEKELENFKSKMLWDKILIPVLIFVVSIFVICSWAVYNKYKRKP